MELPKWEEKKIVAVDLWQCCCQNGREKNVAMERERERERERELSG